MPSVVCTHSSFQGSLFRVLYSMFFIPCSQQLSPPFSGIWRGSTQASFKHRNSQLALSSSYLTSCCRTHDNPTCAHSTPAQPGSHRRRLHHVCVCMARKRFELSLCTQDLSCCHRPPIKSACGECGPPGCTTRVIRLAAACHFFHLASPSPPQPCSWPGRTHSLPLHALAMSDVKPKLGLQPDSFPAGLL